MKRNTTNFSCVCNIILTFEKRYQSTPAGDGTLSVELTESELHVKQRNTTDHQHHAVGNQKCTCEEKYE